MKFSLKKIKDSFVEALKTTTTEEVACIALGTSAALAVVCGWQAGQISDLNKKVDILNKSFDRMAKIGYANDVKAFNNNLLTSYALEAVINTIKGTHPGVSSAVDQAIMDATMDFMSYSDGK